MLSKNFSAESSSISFDILKEFENKENIGGVAIEGGYH